MRGRFAMPVIAALLLLMTVGGSAGAAPPDGLESYDAGADGSALDLRVVLDLLDLELQIAAGLTGAEVTSDGPAAAGDAVGALLAGTEQSGAHAAAPDGEASVEDCAAEVVLPAPIDLTDGTCIVGVSASAAVADGAPAATGESDSLTLSIGGAELTEQLLGALVPVTQPLLDQLDGLLEDLCASLLTPVCELLNLGEAIDVVDSLLGALGDASAGVITITLSPNSSAASADDVDGVIAAAIAEGATIDLLPGLGPNGSSFIEIVVGSSEASVVRDATTGEATAVADPSLVEVNVNGIDLGGITEVVDLGLGDLLDPIIGAVNDLVNTLATASPLACGEPGPLAQIICLDAAAGFILDAPESAAEGYDFGEGTVGARTSALRLELLSLLNMDSGEPVVSLSLAEATAAANATPAVAAPPSTDSPVTLDELPRTGSNDATPIALALGLGLGAVVIGLRRRSAQS